MFIAVLLIIIKTWKQPICPSVGEWINWYIQMMECYSLLKRNELSNYEKTWRNLKCILLHERSQYVKALYCMIPTKWHCGKGRTVSFYCLFLWWQFKRSGITSSWGEDDQTEHRWFLGQWHCFIWYYNGGYLPLYWVGQKVHSGFSIRTFWQTQYIRSIPYNVQQVWTLMYTVSFGWYWCVIVCS